jgi:hypothetical protein
MSRIPKKTTQAETLPDSQVQYDLPKFEPGLQYEVRVSKVIELGPGMILRPSSAKITLSGEKAEELKESILWAKQIKFLE